MRAPGFTLLEMIVVLAILGLAASLVGPSMLRSIDTWRRQAALESVLDQIRGLPGEARTRGVLDVSDAALASDAPPLHIEAEWSLRVPTPWRVSANGVCEGGQVDVVGKYGTLSIRVAAPFCDPELLP